MNNLKPDNNVPRQATFETEPADTVNGRSIKRGDINIPFIDSKAVKNGKPDPISLKEKNALKKEQLQSLKEKEQKERELKNKELRDLKEKKKKELETKKEKLLKANNDKEKESNPQKAKSSKSDHDNELKAVKEKEFKNQNKREMNSELKGQKEELKSQQEKQLKAQKQLKDTNDKEIKLQYERENVLKEKKKKSMEVDSKTTANAKNKKGEELKVKDEKKSGFLSRLGRSLSPSKKQSPQDKVAKTVENEYISVPPLLFVDDERFAEVRVPTPIEKSKNEEDEEKTHFKDMLPHSIVEEDSSVGNLDRNSNDSLTFSKDDVDIPSNGNDKPLHTSSEREAFISDTNATQSSNNSEKMKVLQIFNSNSQRSTQPKEESVVDPTRSRRAVHLRSNPQNQISNPILRSKVYKKLEDDSSLSDSSENDEPHDQVLAERDCLLTAEIAYKRRIKQLEEETNQLAVALESRDNEIKELQWNTENPSSLGEVTNLTKQFQEQIEKLQKEINDLEKEKNKYKILHNDSERKLTETEQENDQLKDKMLLYEQDKLPKIEELQLYNNKLNEKLKYLKTNTKETEEHFEIIKNENKELVDEVRSRKNQVQELLLNLKNQKTAELDLETAKTRLEERLKKLENVENELANSVANTAIIGAEKEHVQSLIKDKEKEIKAIQDIVESKDNDIQNQKLAVELQKEEIDKLIEDAEKQKIEIDKVTKLELDIVNHKETLKVLQNELDDLQKENNTLKEEKEEGKQKIIRIQEHVQASAEINVSLRKIKESLEAEKKLKSNLEEELSQSKEEVSKLQQQNMELNIKVGNLNERFNSDSNQNRLKIASKHKSSLDEKLVDENRRLKIRLVENNVDQLNVKDDKQAMSSRLEHLERKQVDNDVKVKQLQGWLDEIISDPPATNRLSPVANYAAKLPNNVIPRVAIAAQSDKSPLKRTKSTKLRKQRDMSPQAVQGNKPNTRIAVSLSDVRLENETSGSSTPSLPIIQDIPEQIPVYNSYFYLYKQKQKLMRQQQRIR